MLFRLKTKEECQYMYAVFSETDVTKKKDSQEHYLIIDEETFLGHLLCNDSLNISAELDCFKPDKVYLSALWEKFVKEKNQKTKMEKRSTQPASLPSRRDRNNSESANVLSDDEEDLLEGDDDAFFDEASARPSKLSNKKNNPFCVCCESCIS